MLWHGLFVPVVRALQAAGLAPFLAMATLIPFGRHRIPLPWHGIAELGLLKGDKARATRALREAGYEMCVRRGILKIWHPTGVLIRSVLGGHVLTAYRVQRWPWLDVSIHEGTLSGCFTNAC